ncbi:MAG: TolC family protein [Myxococcales bacterium]|nr:TolC family protein [Myxococcales bacterium]
MIRAAVMGLALALASPALAAPGLRLEDVERNPDAHVDALSLGTVLDAVDAHHPNLQAAQAGVDAARGEQTSAEGGFDLVLGATGKAVPFGKDVWLYTDTGLRQPTTLWGAEVFGGWRRSGGDVPLYEGDKITTGNGELTAGVTVPLWQGGPIDARRAKLRQAGVKVDLAQLDVDSARLKLRASAAKAYWKWVAAGHTLRISQGLLDMAELRNEQLEARVRDGDLADIELIENQRAILKRRSELVKARQKLNEAALDLSLFLRDGEGRPVVPPPGAVPDHFPEPEPDPVRPLAEDQAAARARQPMLAKLEAYRAVAAVDRDLADNELAPQIDLTVAGIQPLTADADDPYRKTELEAGLKFKLPLQRRKAQGARASAEAALRRIDAELTFAGQAVDAGVAQARVELEAATQRVGIALQELDVARKVELAEKTRLSLGESTLLIVNLREQKTADAANRVVSALADHHLAYAAWLTVTAMGLDRAEWAPSTRVVDPGLPAAQ